MAVFGRPVGAKIVDARRPLVVTPDRRNDPERSEDTSLIQVPNALRAKANKDIKPSATPEAIAATCREINLHRIRRWYSAIRFTIERLRTSFQCGAPQGHRVAQLVRLKGLIDELKKRIKGTDFADSTQLCVAMANVAAKRGASEDGVTEIHFGLLKRTGMALLMSFE